MPTALYQLDDGLFKLQKEKKRKENKKAQSSAVHLRSTGVRNKRSHGALELSTLKPLLSCPPLSGAATMATTSASYSPYEIRHRDPNPKAAALLVIDMQNHFSSVAAPILPSLNRTIHLCRAASVPVLFTRHLHRSPADYGMLAEWWGDDLILAGSPASRLLPALARRDSDRVVEKNTYSAFHGTGLEELLREMGVGEVIVTGVMTNLCCETTARDAFVRGFRVFFSVDATATANKELHEATVKNLAYGFAYLVDCDRLEAALGQKE